MTKAACIVLLFVGCARSTPAEKPEPRAETIDCHVAAEHGVGVQSTSPDMVAKTKAAVAASCERNAWSEESKRCIVGAETQEARSDCGTLLTQAQTAALQADLAAAFEGQPGVTVQTTSETSAGEPSTP